MVKQTKDILEGLDRLEKTINSPPGRGMPSVSEVWSVLAEISNAKTLPQLAQAKLNVRRLQARILRGPIDGNIG